MISLQLAKLLEAAGTAVLFGGSNVNVDLRSGGRFTLGGWLDDCLRHDSSPPRRNNR
jgi:hypothetical protein